MLCHTMVMADVYGRTFGSDHYRYYGRGGRKWMMLEVMWAYSDARIEHGNSKSYRLKTVRIERNFGEWAVGLVIRPFRSRVIVLS